MAKINWDKLVEIFEEQSNAEDFEWFDFDEVDNVEGVNDNTIMFCWQEEQLELDKAFDSVLNELNGKTILEKYCFWVKDYFFVVVKYK